MPEANEVLVVDNNADVRDVLAATLRHHGLGVRLAGGVAEAAKVYQAYRPTVGVVLLDVLLGDGDGPAALALLRQIDPSVRCCFITAGTSGRTDEDLLGLGAAHVFHKPLTDYADLARKLQSVTRG